MTNQDFANITQRVISLENQYKQLNHVINGNGQPGLVSRFEKAITDLYRIMDRLERIEEKEKIKHLDWQWIATAIIAVVAIVAQYIK